MHVGKPHSNLQKGVLVCLGIASTLSIGFALKKIHACIPLEELKSLKGLKKCLVTPLVPGLIGLNFSAANLKKCYARIKLDAMSQESLKLQAEVRSLQAKLKQDPNNGSIKESICEKCDLIVELINKHEQMAIKEDCLFLDVYDKNDRKEWCQITINGMRKQAEEHKEIAQGIRKGTSSN